MCTGVFDGWKRWRFSSDFGQDVEYLGDLRAPGLEGSRSVSQTVHSQA
jgi:hypothetical protein